MNLEKTALGFEDGDRTSHFTVSEAKAYYGRSLLPDALFAVKGVGWVLVTNEVLEFDGLGSMVSADFAADWLVRNGHQPPCEVEN